MSNYQDFFCRGERVSRDWENPISRPKKEDIDNGKLGQLHRDVFDHHHYPESVPYYVDSLAIQKNDAARIISLDNLTDYYLNSTLPVETPLIEAAFPEDFDVENQEDSPILFSDFVSAVTDIPFNEKAVEHDRLGGNRIVYLFGDVGSGKSFLVARLVAKILRYPVDSDGFTVIPIRVCFESLFRAGLFREVSIEVPFFRHLLSTIDTHCHRVHRGAVSRPSTDGVDTEQAIFSIIGDYVLRLAKNKMRIVLIFDNIDRFHYKYSRFLFFDDKHVEFQERIKGTIIKLCNVLADNALLGNYGMCCLIVARENVARDFRKNLADPDGPIFEDHRTFWVQSLNPEEIIESRFKLLDEAAKAISNAGISLGSGAEATYVDALMTAKNLVLDNARRSSDGLGNIWELCHHGHRSLVDFIAKIKLNYHTHRDIHGRLFGKNPHNLERIYITNLMRRYSQEQNHFPNIFLSDATVNSENYAENVACGHRHTYWLKYLILRFVSQRSYDPAGVTGRKVIDFFHGELGYEEKLVKLCLGSLCMVNESRCIEFCGSVFNGAASSRLKATRRGELLIKGRRSPNYSRPYCFDLNYLQLVIDDYWLALPKKFSGDIFVDANLSHSFDVPSKYGSSASRYLLKKIPATLRFVRLLEASWKYEVNQSRERMNGLKDVEPNFVDIFNNLEGTVTGLIEGGFNGMIRSDDGAHMNVQEMKNLIQGIRADGTYDEFFQNFSRADCLVTQCSG